MSFFTRLRTPTFSNTGSTARDHLASERTFLAWVRTGLGFVALGIAIERFFELGLDGVLGRLKRIDRSITPPSVSVPSTPVSSQSITRQPEIINPSSYVLVATLLGMGGGAIVYGTVHYFSNLRLLERGKFRPAYYGAGVLGMSVAGLAGGAYWKTIGGRIRRQSGEESGKIR